MGAGRRAKTLARPERFELPTPLVRSHLGRSGKNTNKTIGYDDIVVSLMIPAEQLNSLICLV
jgi:hypothetical protein